MPDDTKPPLPPRPPWGPDCDAEVLALVRAGYNDGHLSHAWGLSRAWVRYCCARAEQREKAEG